jgi:hypothetical protein
MIASKFVLMLVAASAWVVQSIAMQFGRGNSDERDYLPVPMPQEYDCNYQHQEKGR